MTTPRTDDATRDELFNQIRETQEKLRAERAGVVAAPPKGLLAAAEGPYVCPGFIDLLGAGAVHVSGWMMYPSETGWGKVKYDGTLYGFAAIHGAGAPIMVMSVSRDELLGDVSSEINVGGVGPGLVQMNLWRGNKSFGHGGGGGVFEGIGVIGGTLKFERM